MNYNNISNYSKKIHIIYTSSHHYLVCPLATDIRPLPLYLYNAKISRNRKNYSEIPEKCEENYQKMFCIYDILSFL